MNLWPSAASAKFDAAEGKGGLTWDERSRMGPLRGVIDAADVRGSRNRYLHELHRHVLAEFFRRSKRKFRRALDFGTGTGRFLPLLATVSNEVHAVDRSQSMVDAALAYNGQFASSISHCATSELAFPSGYFDLVLSFSVLSVMARELLDPCLAELARVCEHSGFLVLYEKICKEDGLTVQFYTRKLRQAGFRAFAAYPARSGSSRFIRLAMRPWLMSIPIRWLARLEVYLTSHGLYGSKHDSYVEYFFACERIDEPRTLNLPMQR